MQFPWSVSFTIVSLGMVLIAAIFRYASNSRAFVSKKEYEKYMEAAEIRYKDLSDKIDRCNGDLQRELATRKPELKLVQQKAESAEAAAKEMGSLLNKIIDKLPDSNNHA